jgi:sulfur-carrier protein
MIRVVLPYHLRTLARVDGEVLLEVKSPATVGAVLEALEKQYPILRGTFRDRTTRQRRPFVRFFACQEDLSHVPHGNRIAWRRRRRRRAVSDHRCHGGRVERDFPLTK